MHHIHAQHVAKAARELLQPVDGAVCALPDPVCIAVADEALLEQRLDDVAERVVYDAVTKRGGADTPALRLVDGKMAIRTGLIDLVRQFVLQGKQTVRDLELKAGRAGRASFPFGSLAEGKPQVIPLDDGGIHGGNGHLHPHL